MCVCACVCACVCVRVHVYVCLRRCTKALQFVMHMIFAVCMHAIIVIKSLSHSYKILLAWPPNDTHMR